MKLSSLSWVDGVFLGASALILGLGVVGHLVGSMSWQLLGLVAMGLFVAHGILTTLGLGKVRREARLRQEAMARGLHDQEAAVQAYARFVPVQFLQHLGRESITDAQLGDQVGRIMTVLFSDIRNFTTLSERLSPEDNFRFLNGYLSQVGPIIRENFGFIDKYIGDAVMALFDGPVDEALAAAMTIQLRTAEYNRTLTDHRFGPLQVGIGLHAGPLMLGIVGEKDRMESTVIADTVNLASRIESLTKHYDCRILVSRSTFEDQHEPGPYMTRPVDLVRVKGRTRSTELLEILDERFDTRAALKIDLAARLAEAMMVYRRGDFQEARTIFQALAYKDPDDNLYSIYRQRIEERIRLGTPPGWDGTTVFDVK